MEPDGPVGGTRCPRLMGLVLAALIVLGLAGCALFAAGGLVAWELGLC